ncbi:hypothetical protein ACFXD5_22635 [Streptomyces sp. NPDC059385]|uniref:hypothetical protein n=1 Tax=Streptomyces sp. NPDC059385 TaxID=3346817 RepID=UPI0036CF3BCB
MAKKKPETESGLTPAPSGVGVSNGKPAAPTNAGLVLTAVPQTPAAADAREELLKAIASEATAISTSKEKGKSADALETLARAYALTAHGPTARTLATGASSRGFIEMGDIYALGDSLTDHQNVSRNLFAAPAIQSRSSEQGVESIVTTTEFPLQ